LEAGDISEIAEAMEEEENNESQFIDKRRNTMKLISVNCSMNNASEI